MTYLADHLIWSHEHEAWWKPNRRGYTGTLREAGLYPRDVAEEICRDAAYRWLRYADNGLPPEVTIPAPDGDEDWASLKARIDAATQTTIAARKAAETETTTSNLEES